MNRFIPFISILLMAITPSLALGLHIGDTAPVFQASSTEGTIRLVDYLGKKNVVLALYFAAFTSV
ncbi:MAG: alkyl hydroperoxide reductase [Thermodesulfobacteriota bacterium]|nr:alkyl hydroperoxide reductase [Thermodesulfobacteriota bacterium]